MNNRVALIIDDEPDIIELLKITLARMNVDCRTAGDLESARKLLLKNKSCLRLDLLKL